MDVSASTTLPKAPSKRARSTIAIPKAAEAVAKKGAAPRKAKKAAAVPRSSEEITGMISMAAYYLAASRGFAPGNELEDWLAAERQVLAALE
jgi:hypothetical protein